MKYTTLGLSALLLLAVNCLHAQNDDPPGLYVGPGSSLTVGPGATVTVLNGDLHVDEGAILVNEGKVHVGQDLIVDGVLRVVLRGDDYNPRHGHLDVEGEAEYRGSLVVAKARGSHFKKQQDFVLASYTAGFGTLTAKELPGAEWVSEHRVSELVVHLTGENPIDEEVFGIALDATLLEDRILVDWVVHFDYRTTNYVVERFDLATNNWADLGEIPGLNEEAESAYFSTIDNDVPETQQVVRYRIRLEDENGMWHYSKEALVAVGEAPELRVFPNPATGQHVQLLGVDQQRELASLRLISTQGQVLRNYDVVAQDLHVLELPADIQGAVYFVEVAYTDGGRQTCQVVVVR
ncbi:MAG: T9SS type A sorting domain-containing protein [Saprospiraceae bacterium]